LDSFELGYHLFNSTEPSFLPEGCEPFAKGFVVAAYASLGGVHLVSSSLDLFVSM